MITKIRLGESYNYLQYRNRQNTTSHNSHSNSINFTANKAEMLNSTFKELKNLYSESYKILTKAENDARNFESNGKKFRNISEHIKITSDAMKNNKGQDFWIEFSSTKQLLNYGSYRSPQISTQIQDNPGITIATSVKNRYEKDIKYIVITPETIDNKEKYFEIYNTSENSAGGYSILIRKEDKNFSAETQNKINTIKEALTKFIEHMQK